jgi:hypothetical protein
VDNQGQEIPVDTGAQIRMGSANDVFSEIAPGQSVTGPLVFDVPVGGSLRSVLLRAGFTTGGVTIALS